MGGLAIETTVLGSVHGVNLDDDVASIVGDNLAPEVVLYRSPLVQFLVARIFGSFGTLDGVVRVEHGVVSSNALHPVGIKDRAVLRGVELRERLHVLVEPAVDRGRRKFVLIHVGKVNRFRPLRRSFGRIIAVWLHASQSTLQFVLISLLLTRRAKGRGVVSRLGVESRSAKLLSSMVLTVAGHFGESVAQLGASAGPTLEPRLVTEAKFGLI